MAKIRSQELMQHECNEWIKMSHIKRMLKKEESYDNIKLLLFDFLTNEVRENRQNSILAYHKIRSGIIKALLNFLSSDHSLNKDEMRLFDDCSIEVVIRAPANPRILQSSYHLSQRAIADIANYKPLTEEVLDAYMKLLVTERCHKITERSDQV